MRSSRARWSPALLLLTLPVGACATEGESPVPVAHIRAAAAADFADLDATQTCQWVADCCSAAGYSSVMAQCKSFILAVNGISGELGGVTTQRVTGPDVAYNDLAATQCLAGIASLGCDNIGAANYKAMLQSCYAVYTGTLPMGSACAVTLECAPGNFCDSATGTCEPLRALGDACMSGEECGYRGVGASCDPNTGTCVGALPDGDACASGLECNSGLCDGTCTQTAVSPFTAAFCADMTAGSSFDAQITLSAADIGRGGSSVGYGGWAATVAHNANFAVSATKPGATFRFAFGGAATDPVTNARVTNGCQGGPPWKCLTGGVSLTVTTPGFCGKPGMYDTIKYTVDSWDPVSRVLEVRIGDGQIVPCVFQHPNMISHVGSQFKLVLPP